MASRISFQLEEKGYIQSITHFLEDAENLFERLKARVFFRGHSDNQYELLPTIGRSTQYGGIMIPHFKFEQEQRLLHRFRRQAYPHLNKTISTWEALILARHHSLPTRLLDWSNAPLPALYFACSAHPDKDADLWAFGRYSENTSAPNKDLDVISAIEKNVPQAIQLWRKPVSKTNQFTYDKILLVYPISNSPRIVAQGGVFTWHSNPTIRLNDYIGKLFNPGNIAIRCLYRWKISKDTKNKLLKSLHRLGVSQRTLFPDLDGLASCLWKSEVLFSGG